MQTTYEHETEKHSVIILHYLTTSIVQKLYEITLFSAYFSSICCDVSSHFTNSFTGRVVLLDVGLATTSYELNSISRVSKTKAKYFF